MQHMPRHSTSIAKLFCIGSLLGASTGLSVGVVAPTRWALVSIAIADEAPRKSGAETPSVYKSKTAAQWIAQLRRSRDAQSRSQAAEALGYMARETSQTFGGFSDVPINSPEPPKLGDEVLRPIVDALTAGLNDSTGSVRASSAVAISWIGPRAKSAVPTLIRRLDDPDKEAREKVVSAIGRIGPPAKGATPQLERMLAKSDGNRRVEIAGAMRLIGAAPESYVPALIKLLARKSDTGLLTAELAQLGDPAVAALKQALKDKDATTRQNAAYAIGNMAGWGKLTKDRESVADALIERTRDDNRSVVWCATQAIGSVHAAPERCVPALVSLLKHEDQSVANNAAKSLGEFGADAKSALPDLIGVLGGGSKEISWDVAYAIRQIGIDQVSADALRALKSVKRGSWLLVPLCEYPEAAAEFLQGNPEAAVVPVRDQGALIHLMRDPDPRFQQLQDLLYQNDDLPLAVIAQLGEARFLPMLEQKMKTANAHEKTELDACARACGAPADRVVAIAELHPGDFKPQSAWPGTDRRRMDPHSQGHGDGITTVIVTGRLLGNDGTAAVEPKFYRTNDAMLLGQRIRDEEPITFDAKTGRFVFVTQVFAAFSMGPDQQEPGPYQTGSSLIHIESVGCKPLDVQFFDEMPEVCITLSAVEKKAAD
jgi:HEAT repeat protein